MCKFYKNSLIYYLVSGIAFELREPAERGLIEDKSGTIKLINSGDKLTLIQQLVSMMRTVQFCVCNAKESDEPPRLAHLQNQPNLFVMSVCLAYLIKLSTILWISLSYSQKSSSTLSKFYEKTK